MIVGKKQLKVKAYELDPVIKELRLGLVLTGKRMAEFESEVLVKD